MTRKCIFNNVTDCDRFVHGEYVCTIFGERCKNFKYKMSCTERESGNIISLSFKDI